MSPRRPRDHYEKQSLEDTLERRKDYYLNMAQQILQLAHSTQDLQVISRVEKMISDVYEGLTQEFGKKRQPGQKKERITAERYNKLRDSGLSHQDIRKLHLGNLNALQGYARWYEPKKE